MATVDDVYALLQTVDGKVDQLIAACITNAAGVDIAADIASAQLSLGTIDGKVDDLGTALATVDGIVDDILVDTGTTLNAKVADIPGDIWDAPVASYTTPGTFGEALGDASGSPWDHLIVDHVAEGSFGFHIARRGTYAESFLDTTTGYRWFVGRGLAGASSYLAVYRVADGYYFNFSTNEFQVAFVHGSLTEDANMKGLFYAAATGATPWDPGDYIAVLYQIRGVGADPIKDAIMGITVLSIVGAETSLLDVDYSAHTTTLTLGETLNLLRDHVGLKPQVGI